jgi:hypothetical protein
VESSCELGNEPSGSIKCWELPSGCSACGLSSGTQLHRVSWLVSGGRSVGIFRSRTKGHGDCLFVCLFSVTLYLQIDVKTYQPNDP